MTSGDHGHAATPALTRRIRARSWPWRRRALAAAILLVVSTLVPPGVEEPAEAAVLPGSSAWLETLDRGNHFRLMVSGLGGDRVLAAQVYGRPAFSPDGTRVAYSAPLTDGSDGRYALFVIDVNGGNRRRLTTPAIGDFDPAWSPDGSTIAVSRDELGNFEDSCCTLWLVPAGGGAQRRLANAQGARQPAFSPNGTNLAYAGTDAIHIAGASGTGNRVISTGALSWPTWSPDGQTVAAARRTGAQTGTVSLMPYLGGTRVDTSAGSGGGIPEAPVYSSAATLLHLNAWGDGEDGRTRAEVRRTTIGGTSTAVYRTGRPMFYYAWTGGGPCAEVSTTPPPSPAVASPMIIRFGAWFLRRGLSSGSAEACFNYGRASGHIPLTGDWDGNGTRTPAVFQDGTWSLRNTNTHGGADIVLGYGRAGDRPVAGDWDGDGTDTIGVLRGGTWYLRNSNTSGVADITYTLGRAGDRPVAGDWDGDGTDTAGLFRSGTWYLANQHHQNTADITTSYGRPTDRPIVADWNGDGTDTIGVFRDGAWFLSNDNTSRTHQIQFSFGRIQDTPVVWQ